MMLVEEFKDNLIEDGKSANTVQSYVGDISAFIKYLRKMGVEFEGKLKRFYITSYKNYLIENSYNPPRGLGVSPFSFLNNLFNLF